MKINNANLPNVLYEMIKTNKKFNYDIEILYLLQYDKVLKKMYNDLKLSLNISKDELTEFTIMLILANHSPFIARQILKFGPSKIKFATKNNQGVPDVQIGKQFYEITAAELNIFKFKDGIEYEKNMQKESVIWAKKQSISIKYSKKSFFIEHHMIKIGENFLKAILKKIEKPYINNKNVNLVLWHGRFLNNHMIFSGFYAVYYLLQNYKFKLISIFEKIPNIYILTFFKNNTSKNTKMYDYETKDVIKNNIHVHKCNMLIRINLEVLKNFDLVNFDTFVQQMDAKKFIKRWNWKFKK